MEIMVRPQCRGPKKPQLTPLDGYPPIPLKEQIPRSPSSVRYVAFLLGINIGPHKKVPMANLKEVLEKLGFTNVKTLLNSGNAI